MWKDREPQANNTFQKTCLFTAARDMRNKCVRVPVCVAWSPEIMGNYQTEYDTLLCAQEKETEICFLTVKGLCGRDITGNRGVMNDTSSLTLIVRILFPSDTKIFYCERRLFFF